MSLESRYVLASIIVGIGATLLVDLWNFFLRRTFSIQSLNYCLLGRWICHMREGTFSHVSITRATQKSFECTIGWIAHYSIGVVLTFVFVFTSSAWLAQPTLLPALLFGIGTVVFPLFILQPAFGLGIASSKSPNPMQSRLKSFMTHTVFGFGLWVCGLGVSYVL